MLTVVGFTDRGLGVEEVIVTVVARLLRQFHCQGNPRHMLQEVHRHYRYQLLEAPLPPMEDSPLMSTKALSPLQGQESRSTQLPIAQHIRTTITEVGVLTGQPLQLVRESYQLMLPLMQSMEMEATQMTYGILHPIRSQKGAPLLILLQR